MKNIFIILSLTIFAFACSSNCCKKESTSTTIQCSIEGMTCTGCETTIKSKLEAVEGVKVTEINYETGKATISIANSDVAPAQLCKLVDEAGYKCNMNASSDSTMVSKEECKH